MTWQSLLLLISISSFIFFIQSFYQSSKKKAFEETPWLLPWGIFVWGDGVVFGLFWFIISVLTFALNDWNLFLLIYSIFWLVRSLGEVLYWIHEQFAKNHRNEPKNLRGYSLVKNDSVYFLYQIVWQCVMVVSIIFAIYFGVIWVRGI